MPNNLLLAFLKEFLLRLKAKSPKFFVIISYTSGFVALLTGLPGLLQELNIAIPHWMEFFQNKVAGVGAFIAFIMSQLPADTKAVAQTQEGEVLKTTEKKDLPFTTKVEEKKAEKQDLPVVTPTEQ